ncbi:hypothetical protein SSTU70S_00592 [Stutzerimonas stutzeri]
MTIVHKGNIMKFTEGAFKEWGYEVARDEFGAELLDGGPWMQFKNPNTGKNIVVKDAIADAMLQQILLRPAEYDVIATLNLNGDYLSDALAAEVARRIGIAPVANLSDTVAQCVDSAPTSTWLKPKRCKSINMQGNASTRCFVRSRRTVNSDCWGEVKLC